MANRTQHSSFPRFILHLHNQIVCLQKFIFHPKMISLGKFHFFCQFHLRTVWVFFYLWMPYAFFVRGKMDTFFNDHIFPHLLFFLRQSSFLQWSFRTFSSSSSSSESGTCTRLLLACLLSSFDAFLFTPMLFSHSGAGEGHNPPHRGWDSPDVPVLFYPRILCVQSSV